MREVVIGAERRRDRCLPPRDPAPARHASGTSSQRVAIVFWFAIGFALIASTEASAKTLRLAFSDGEPMTHGSACSGDGCLQRGAGLAYADANGEVRMATTPDRTVEYRRDGIDLALAPVGSASGREPVGEGTTVVFPRLLQGTAPAVDAIEADVVYRINEARRARGLALAELNVRLSAAADLQATWLSNNGVGMPLPLLSHTGPFGSTIEFRLAEVSFPEPTGGSEIAAAGTTPAQALALWLLSAVHRDVVLAPGPLLIGAAQVGSVIIVDTHPPCRGCASAAPLAGSAGAPVGTSGLGSAGAQDTSGPSGAGGASGRAGDRAASCGAEQLRVRRLRDGRRSMRLRVTVGCLRSGSGYTLSVLQHPSRKRLTTRTIAGAGAITLALRPSRTTRTLRIKLKRNGRAVAARTVSRRAAERR